MKMTVNEYINALHSMGVDISVHDDVISLTGQDKEVINRLYDVLTNSPDFKKAIINRLRTYSKLSCKDFLQEFENTGVKMSVEFSGFELDLNFTDGKEKARSRLMNLLNNDKMLKAKIILSQAMNNPDLMDAIQERACIRYADGYSDSLIIAVMSYFAPTGEKEHKELRPQTDWTKELKK